MVVKAFVAFGGSESYKTEVHKGGVLGLTTSTSPKGLRNMLSGIRRRHLWALDSDAAAPSKIVEEKRSEGVVYSSHTMSPKIGWFAVFNAELHTLPGGKPHVHVSDRELVQARGQMAEEQYSRLFDGRLLLNLEECVITFGIPRDQNEKIKKEIVARKDDLFGAVIELFDENSDAVDDEDCNVIDFVNAKSVQSKKQNPDVLESFVSQPNHDHELDVSIICSYICPPPCGARCWFTPAELVPASGKDILVRCHTCERIAGINPANTSFHHD